ncbi:Ethylbenzene dehydrogenase [Thiohalomonas denitrificans]|uniref:Ethylbenzene dehydrogenase n=2 Tax=Thiohalomonas denitrificans TaxID=415747 RepID=A0A1G5QVH1_9GAMM|nr:Ethylbenzene dehydrogenase [Thiohalomonas denitrificans]
MNNEKLYDALGPEVEAFPFKRRATVLAVLLASTVLTTGCLSSGSDNDPIVDDDPIDDDDGGTASAFKVDFMTGAPTVTWGEAETVTAFRPAQASYEYLDTGDHSGAGMLTSGCSGCHDTNANNPSQVGAERDEAALTPSEETVPITVQAAYDAENFYLKASWDTPRPGITHDLFRYDGSAWEKVSMYNEPGNEPTGNQRFSAEDRFALMFMPASQDIGVGDISFHDGGCFTTCHEDMDDMPEWDGSTATGKYLASSSTANGDYADGSSSDAAVLDGTTDSFPDMWHFRGARSAIINTLTDGYVMDGRNNDDSPNFYHAQNPDDTTGDLEYMYDATWMEGFIADNFPDYEGETRVNALPAAVYDAIENNAPTLVTAGDNQNAVAFDAATANFEEGDYIPRRWLSEETGSRTDVKAYSAWEDGTWTVIFERPLDTGNEDDHALSGIANGEGFSFAFAAHQDNTVHRWHHVTFPITVGLNGDIVPAAN